MVNNWAIFAHFVPHVCFPKSMSYRDQCDNKNRIGEKESPWNIPRLILTLPKYSLLQYKLVDQFGILDSRKLTRFLAIPVDEEQITIKLIVTNSTLRGSK